MKTKSTVLALLLGSLALAALSLSGCSSSKDSTADSHAHQYTCSMHPEVVRDKPGDCPKCGMKLVQKP